MKQLLFATLFAVTAMIATTANAQEKAKWKEMEEFHKVMSSTFHPSEEGNLKPIRTMSAEMVAKAQAWEGSNAPEGYDKNSVKKSLKDLVKGAKDINKLVKSNAKDAVLKDKLAKLHDVFHQVMEKCEKEEHQH